MDDEDRTPDLPTGEAWRIGLGARYAWSAQLAFNLAYELLWMGDLDMGFNRGPLAGRVEGTYDDAAIHSGSAPIAAKKGAEQSPIQPSCRPNQTIAAFSRSAAWRRLAIEVAKVRRMFCAAVRPKAAPGVTARWASSIRKRARPFESIPR